MKVVIAGINYAPELTGISPYTTALAEHLASEGHAVSVVCGRPSYPHWRVHDDYRGLIARRERINDVDVHRRWNFVPRSQSAILRGAYEASYGITGALIPGLGDADAFVGIVPSLSGGVLARMWGTFFRKPYGVLFQDLLGPASAQSGISGGSAVAKAVAKTEGWVARGARRVAVVADGFRSYLHQAGVPDERIMRVRNWTHIPTSTRDRDVVRKEFEWGPDQIVCLHAGNMGYKQALENIVEAARLLEANAWIQFVLVGDGSQRQELEDRARGLTNLTFTPLQPDELFADILAAADILLLNQRTTVEDMSLPGKLTSYFASGRPVVAAVAATSESALEILAARAGIVVEPEMPRELADAIQRLTSSPEEMTQLGRCGRLFAETTLAAPAALARLTEFLQEVIEKRVD